MFEEEFLTPFLTLFSEHDRFGLAHRIEDHALRVQTIHGLVWSKYTSEAKGAAWG
jgi:hypothetical protein